MRVAAADVCVKSQMSRLRAQVEAEFGRITGVIHGAGVIADGPLLTKTLLISALSAGGSNGGPRLVARDKTTGEELGSVDLPTGAVGTPMTYLVDGTQYIALTIGGQPPNLIAFALPD